MFKKILIANRGEIAVRIARSARAFGVRTVAVYSDVDRNAPHVSACDEAVQIGPPAPAESYLRAERIIAAAKKTDAEAVHPGYGFLSENAEFAEALEKEGIVFIGPTAETIRAMGSKSAAKDLMEKAGVPTTPGYQGEDQSLETFRKEAKRIGYPVLLKATAGGGGKGMRMVSSESELADAVASAQREGKSAFGDARLLVEKFLPRARHVEVQIFGDGKGEVVHLFERDCSVQRRHQKIIEEAPAPNLPKKVRKKLLEAGVNAGKAVNYRGAGTVEFLYDGVDNVFFMEMNTRLQVEHPVSEAITGLDLVEWQLRVASGEPLPLKQSEIGENGWAFEARLYAENPDNNFAPSIGDLTTLRLPAARARIDSGVAEGQTITPHYDPMIAKIITHGASREEALAKLSAALAETRVAGLETNARFLHALAGDEGFIKGEVSTRYIDDHGASLFAHAPLDNRARAAALYRKHLEASGALHPEEPRSFALRDGPSALLRMKERGVAKDEGRRDPWRSLTGFRLNKPAKEVYWLANGGEAAIARMVASNGGFDVEIEANAAAAIRREGGAGETPAIHFAFSGAKKDSDYRITLVGETFEASVIRHHEGVRVFIGAEYWDMTYPDVLSGVLGHHSAEGSLAAPMPGVITLLSANPGDEVEAGATLLVMEAMKMEHAIKAPHDGVIKAFRFKPGDQVKDGDLLVEFEESA